MPNLRIGAARAKQAFKRRIDRALVARAPEPGAGDSYLEWDVTNGQTYYLAVRGRGSGSSDPRTLSGRAAATSLGDYIVTVAPAVPDLAGIVVQC